MNNTTDIIKTNRLDHAAHCFSTGKVLWDLESIHVLADPDAESWAPKSPRAGYEFDVGYLDADKRQVWVFVRRCDPRRATCDRCTQEA